MEKVDNALQIFNSEEFGEIRSVDINGEPWFYGSDVAKALGYINTRDALLKHVWDEDKNTVAIRDGIPGNPRKVLINESGLYALIFNSKLEKARSFSHWVTSEVLPTIRKHGIYVSPDLLKREEELQKEINELKKQLLEDKTPSMTYKDYVIQRKYDAVSTSMVAADFDLSARKLNEILLIQDVQYKDEYGKWHLCPEYDNKGYTKEETYTYASSVPFGITTMKWTREGCLFIADVLANRYCPIYPVVEKEQRMKEHKMR